MTGERETATPPGSPRQLPLFDAAAGRAGKREGTARADAGADPVWREAAYLALQGLARTRSEVHVDDLYATCAWRPPRPNAWGAVWQRALREGLLVKTGRSRPTRLPEKHAHDYPVYRSLIFRRDGAPAHVGGAGHERPAGEVEE